MGMSYAELRILDKDEKVYIEFPKIKFYPGINASDFSENFSNGVLKLNSLLTNNGKHTVMSLEIRLIDKSARIIRSDNEIDGFTDISVVINEMILIQNNLR